MLRLGAIIVQIEPVLESSFDREFRRTGILWSAYACAASFVLVVLFLAFPQLSKSVPTGAVVIRVVILLVLAWLAYILTFRREFALQNYVVLVTTGSAVSLGGVVLMVAIPSFDIVSKEFSPIPALMFGLLLNYGFLRLPLKVVGALCVSFSVAIVFLSPEPLDGSGQLRVALYLLSANILGMVLSRSIETRERNLYQARREAEAAQKALSERAHLAEEAHVDKTRLLAAVSHDLRQPMMAVRTYLGNLSRRLQRGDAIQAQRQADLLSKSVDVLEETLDHVLTAARYDNGTEPIQVSPVALAPILRRLRETFATEAATKGLELRIRIPDRPIVVNTDAVALWRVLMNLVSNALKFTSPQGRRGRGVLVSVRLQDNLCRIVVADTGIGISKEHLETIWLPYFQLSNAARNREQGLGLGLFLVRRAITQLPDHDLRLRSTLGRGTRFALTLPGTWASNSDEPAIEKPVLDEHQLSELQGGFVLILEDDPQARQALEELLDEWGMVFASGGSLHEVFVESERSVRLPDAIISDFRLPGELNGADCIRVLRKRLDLDVPAVIITGESDLAHVRRLIPDKTDLIQKPFDSALLAAPLLSAVRAARAAEQI